MDSPQIPSSSPHIFLIFVCDHMKGCETVEEMTRLEKRKRLCLAAIITKQSTHQSIY